MLSILVVLLSVYIWGGSALLGQEPEFSVPAPLRPVFSNQPSDAEIMRVRLFKDALAPMEIKPVAGENAALAEAIGKFAKRTSASDARALVEFLDQYPKGRWAAAIYLNLGQLQYGSGAFSKALDSFDRAWDLSKTAKQRPATFIRDRSAAEAGWMNSRLGNRSWLDRFLSEVDGMEIEGSSGEMILHTREAVSMMHSTPERCFMCGPFALLSILPDDVPGEILQEIREPKSTPQGTSLALVYDLAKKTGRGYQVAFRSPGAQLVVPAVVHWNVGHFAALVSERDGYVVSRDPTFGDEVLIAHSRVDEEASGYFLIPDGPLPQGWRKVDVEEAATVWGKGLTSGKNTNETTQQATTCKPGWPCPVGMAIYNVHAMLVSLTISDAPIGYQPAYGPTVMFKATYNQRDVAQPDNKSYSNLGMKWSHNWLGFVQPSGSNATVAEPGGGSVTFSGFNSSTGAYSFDVRSASSMKYISPDTSPGRYERTFADGAKQVFSVFDGSRYFLSAITDAAGNSVTLSYDASFRLTGITDAAGRATTLGYSGAGYQIQNVTDPFGRVAAFAYDTSGRLISITDVIGITSQFTYDGSTTFIKALTTPYGTTNFSFVDGEDRWLEARDPEGNIERTEYRSDTPTIAYGTSDPTGTIPNNVSAPTPITKHFSYRNTFFWDKKAYAEGKGDYTKAHIFHWLHAGSQTSGILESEKTPFESRVCYTYQGQTSYEPIYVDSGMFTARPARILRKLNTGTAAGSTQEIKYTFNALGLPTTFIDPAGRETRYTYDSTNNIDLVAVDQKNGSAYERVMSATYNAKHQPLTITDASGQTTTITYNTNGQRETVTNALGQTTTWHYDGQGRLDYVDGPLTGSSDRISFTYDPVVATRVKTVTDVDGATVTYDYDALDRVTKVTHPDGTYEQIGYNRLDVETLRDRMGRVTRQWHNSLRQLIAEQDPALRTTQYAWCKCGSLKSLIDGNGRRTLWRRDVAARITEKEYADGSKEVYSYDLAGRLVQVIDPAGRTRSFGYAVDNNLLSLTYPQGTGTASVGFTYSPVYNRVATMVDPTGTTTYGYNALGALGGGRVGSVDGPLANDTITYQYDALGRVTQRAINGVARNFVFGDALGRLTQETNSLGQFDYTYDGATPRLATVSAPNGVTTAMSYRALPQDRLLQFITHTGPGSTAISSFEYAYDATGNITHWTQNQSANTVLPVAQWTLSQDGSDQLTGVSVAGHPELTEAYSYDNGGNRLTWQKGDAVTTSAYNVLNQLNSVSGGGKFRVAGTTSEPADVTVQGQPAQMLSPTNFVARPNVTAGTNTITVAATDGSGNTKTNSYQVVVPSTAARSFSYDGNGNLLGDGVRTYEWDGLNRMVKVTKGSDVYEFGYDGLNRRVSETKNGTLLKRFVWDELALAEERDASNVITKRFLPQGEIQGTASYFYTRDHLGSVRELTGFGGGVVASYGYDAWGRRNLLSGTDLASFGYTGHYTHKETDLVLAPFRAYDPEVGRWVSRDPIGVSGGKNLYGYIGNNPLSGLDVFGFDKFHHPENVKDLPHIHVRNGVEYNIDLDERGNPTPIPRPGHERNYDVKIAREHFERWRQCPENQKVLREGFERLESFKPNSGSLLRRINLFRGLSIIAVAVGGLSATDAAHAAYEQLAATGQLTDYDRITLLRAIDASASPAEARLAVEVLTTIGQ